MQRLDLLFQQPRPALQSRMPLRPLGFVIEMPVMALGEDGDAVDVGPFHRPRELARVEVDADVADPRAGVEIEVDLTVTKIQSRPGLGGKL